MLTSMTGHGEACREGDGYEIQVEVRSVNHKQLRVVTKTSEEIAHLQAPLEDLVRARIQRGTIFLTIRFTPTRCTELYEVDEDVLRAYHNTLKALAAELATGETIHIKDLLLLPGSIRAEETSPRKDEFLDRAKEAVAAALDALEAMRRAEGSHLESEFRARRGELTNLLDSVRQIAGEAIVEYQERLEERVRQLLAKHEITVRPEDLIKEVAILAERSDISEEISRMESHLKQFNETLDASGSVGRKLEFLIQEMFREATTMASKSVHSGLSRQVVEIKAELDRLKEQVQNVE